MVAEKAISRVLGESDLAFRFLLLPVGLAALVLFLRLAERLLDGYAVPFAVAMFAIGAPFIRYAAEIKSYGIDMAAMIALSLIALRLRDPDSTRGASASSAELRERSSCGSPSRRSSCSPASARRCCWPGFATAISQTRRALLVTVPIWAVASAAATIVAIPPRHAGHSRVHGPVLADPQQLLPAAVSQAGRRALAVGSDPGALLRPDGSPLPVARALRRPGDRRPDRPLAPQPLRSSRAAGAVRGRGPGRCRPAVSAEDPGRPVPASDPRPRRGAGGGVAPAPGVAPSSGRGRESAWRLSSSFPHWPSSNDRRRTGWRTTRPRWPFFANTASPATPSSFSHTKSRPSNATARSTAWHPMTTRSAAARAKTAACFFGTWIATGAVAVSGCSTEVFPP